MKDYRLVSLSITDLFKILSKIYATSLGPIINMIISWNQLGFIQDCVMTVAKSFNMVRKKSRGQHCH